MGEAKIKTKICPDCKETIIMLLDKTGMLIRYKKMCPCLIEIMRLRDKRIKNFKERKNARR
ncbi:MAG: hypothetical protein ACTSPI_00470 [Candidatus Heimdallarchaeaceae archaeon]